MSVKTATDLEILLVEDDTFDAIMTEKYLKRSTAHYKLNVVHDGEEALDFMYHRGAHGKAPRPDLILLDMGLPKIDGRQVLNQLRADPDLKSIPVVVITGQAMESTNAVDFKLNRHCYLPKWLDMKGFAALIKAAEDFKSAFASNEQTPLS